MVSQNLPNFIPGIELNRMFFQQVVKPLVDKYFSGLRYAVGVVGEGSDVLRFDTPQSMDHNWGPHLRFFLSETDVTLYAKKMSRMFSKELPYEFMGFPTNFTKPVETYLVQRMERISEGSINHFIQIYTIRSFFKHYLGFNPYKKISVKDWLTFPQQALVEVTAGEIYYDTLGIEEIRKKFSYFPDDVWLYMYTVQWSYIGQLEAFVGRTGDVGDELGSNIVAAELVKHLMRLCFLMEKKYMPYSKWFGTAFSRLSCANELTHLLIAVVHALSWQERQKMLGKVYDVIICMHNDLRITKRMDIEVSEFEGRPYKVIHAMEFRNELLKVLPQSFKNMKYFLGSVDQFIGHYTINHENYVSRQLKRIIV